MKVERIAPQTVEVTSDLSKMPSGKADAEIAFWVLSAFQELERLRAENKRIKGDELVCSVCGSTENVKKYADHKGWHIACLQHVFTGLDDGPQRK